MKWRKWLTTGGSLLALAAALMYGFAPKPVLVEVEPVTRGRLRVIVEEEGRTRIKDRYDISAPVAGVADRIALEVGDAVAKGQVVAQLKPLRSAVLDPRSRAQAESRVATAEATLRVAQANVEAAAAAADYASADLKRLQRLHKAGSISREALEQTAAEARRTDANFRSVRFAVDAARYELETARTALGFSAAEDAGEAPEKVILRAPVAGRVLKRYQQSEYVVQAGQPLLELGDPQALEAEVDVLSADAVRIQPGMKVLFERWGGDAALEGRVRMVEPVGFTKISALGVEEQRVWVIADFVSPRARWQRLGDAYRVEASFVLWEEEEVLRAPTSALFRHGKGWAAFVVQDERARLRPVEVGRRSGLTAQIIAGLVEGEQVIVHPDDAVEDGVRVRLR